MGSSTVASHAIMFIAVMTMATSLVVVFKGYVDTTSSAIITQQKFMADQLKTDISISHINYDNTTNKTYVYLKNTGKTKLDIDYVDIYIDSERIPRNGLNRSIQVLADTEITNTGTWDPKEDIEIIVNKTIDVNETHTVIITSSYEGKDTDTFSN